ncbi:MAG: helix-turn-helix transcriptional regulator [Bdellovibrionales bacterium]|nr:helix-turn-helix transcriptional regulator [Bdellovibrionales bacterium]
MSALSRFLMQQSWARVLRPLTAHSRSVRELVDLTGMSPAGVTDVLRRLRESGVVTATPIGKELRYSLALDAEERSRLQAFVADEVDRRLHQRARLLSGRREEVVGWIDETIAAFQETSGRSDDAATTSR